MAKSRHSKPKLTPTQSFVHDPKKRNLFIGSTIIIMLLLVGAITYGATRPGPNEPRKVVIETAKGNIEMEVYPELMPVTVGNFEKLVKSNFYNGLTFHRVEEWVIQGGDPQGNGNGGPGWSIPLETNPKLTNVRGAVAMARSTDPNSAGSQFYILKKDTRQLDNQYAVFGKVVKGMEIVDQIAIGDKMISVKE